MSEQEVVVCAFYKFIPLDEARVREVRERFERFAEDSGLKGLVVMGNEGVNATVSGSSEVIAALKNLLVEIVDGADIPFKDSRAAKAPFSRFKVDVRPEIVTCKDLSISSEESQGTHLTPREWHETIASDPEVLILDTRNDYETEIGVFRGAIDPKIKKFSDFQAFMEREQLPKDKKILMYCTGGIRCEKAVPEVKRLGYENVYQLQGGILKYLEEYPDGFFNGECFVFDHRVSVDKHLQPSQKYRLCPHCGNPAQEKISCKNCDVSAIVCHRCVDREDRHTCSKNCAHHVRLAKKRAA